MRFYKLLLVILFYTSSVEPYNYGIVQAVERGEPLTKVECFEKHSSVAKVPLRRRRSLVGCRLGWRVPRNYPAQMTAPAVAKKAKMGSFGCKECYNLHELGLSLPGNLG